MKRFRFRLQKILDVSLKKEGALKERLFELSLSIVQAQQDLLAKRMELKSLCAEQSDERARGVCEHEDLFAGYCVHLETEMALRLTRVRQLEQTRRDTARMLQETANFRRALETVRESALATHRRSLAREEQKLLDEHAGIRFVRTRGQWIGE